MSGILLNNAWVKKKKRKKEKKAAKEIRKYFELNDKTQHIKILWDATKDVFRDNCLTLSAYIGKSESAKLLILSDSLQPTGFSVCGILQARIREWVATSPGEGALPNLGIKPGFPILLCMHAFPIWATRGGPLTLGKNGLKPLPVATSLYNGLRQYCNSILSLEGGSTEASDTCDLGLCWDKPHRLASFLPSPSSAEPTSSLKCLFFFLHFPYLCTK